MTQRVVSIVGPTASGKTGLGIAIARRLAEAGERAEIVHADAYQMYRGMDIGTAKPTAEEQAAVPHHLIDIIDPEDTMSVARFQQLARETIADLQSRGIRPILVGGSGLYARAAIDDITFPGTDPDVRTRLEEREKTEGAGALFDELRAKDPEAAARMDPRNPRRTIRALEAATGVDLIIDDTPETVILSAYSPLRRQVAKMALERLIQDGRIHPARIEDIVQKCEQELDAQVREVGEQATFDAGVHGIHPEIIRLLGQLRYRTSFTQNVLQHSLEVSALCGMMAAELGMDVKKAKRAGLLHDIGKAVDHEVEGPHALIGADIAKKYNEGKDIVHAIAAHHEDQRPSTALAVLVQAADSISGARPGARKELLENYVKRLEELEGIATSFEGVSKAYAIQAGREIRVMVNPDYVDDDATYLLCKDIAEKIEKNLTYPGQIRVTVIRERRAMGFAK